MAKRITTPKLSDGERLQNGQLYVRAIIEYLGKPEDFVKNAIKEHVKNLKADDKFEVTFEEYAKPKAIEGMFAVFVELELWVKKINYLVELCYDFMPSSIEIIEPENIKITSHDFAGYLNDLQARLHHVDMIVKNFRQENTNLRENSKQLIKNLVQTLLKDGGRTIKQLSNGMGIKEKDLPQFLNVLMKEKFIKKKDDLYSLTK